MKTRSSYSYLVAAAAASAVALMATGASGFILPSSRSSSTVSTAPSLNRNGRAAGAGASPRVVGTTTKTTKTSHTTQLRGEMSISELKDIPGGEAQRMFRRTVYTHDDWKRHRNQDRFVYYLAATLKSGVYKNLAGEVGLATAVATFVVAYNAIVGGYTDLAGVQHAALVSSEFLPKLGLPLSSFTVPSSSLGLLLVFRTNTSYKRWDEARKNWGMNINHTRDLVRMANCYYDATSVPPEERADDLNHVALCTWAFVRAMKRHLSPEEEDEEAFQAELYEKLPEQQAAMIIKAAHRPNRALQDLSYAIECLPMHFTRKNEVQSAVTIFEDDLGSSERILTSPVPLFYSRHLARFLAVWLFLLPFGLYDSFSGSWNHVALIPATVVISTMLFGIEEIGTQLEEPFTVLPMQAFCDKIYNWCMEIVSCAPGDNGRAVKPVRPEHAYFTGGGGAGGGAAAAPPPDMNAPPAHQEPAQPAYQEPAQPAYQEPAQPAYTPPPPAYQAGPKKSYSPFGVKPQAPSRGWDGRS